MITDRSVTRDHALRVPQFYLLWSILFINVTAGIGILSQASPMIQDMFHKTPVQAGAVVSIISVFNLGGRFLWASSSDYIGRRNTYTLFFTVQVVLFMLIPGMAARQTWEVFLASLCVIYTMYGGGFATIPAFLADIFGPENVGAIHGAVLTAWSAAAVAGPIIITELSRGHVYDTSLHVLAAMLAVGFGLTLLVRPLTK
jgi:MFS family permease